MWMEQSDWLPLKSNQCQSGNGAMKVTVCFSGIRVVVPCGDGNGSVRDLMLRAATRYKKATGKATNSWVTVHSLQSSDGGLLDPDDRLNDVADDREQIVAVYEERDGRPGQHGGGDGTSASSDGTRSPVQFTNGGHELQPFSRVDIEVTGQQDPTCSLQVRRGSEPALNQICPLPQFPPSAAIGADTSKRWSAAPIIDDHIQASSTPIRNTSLEQLTPPGEREEASGDERDRPPFSRFARDSNRLSMQIGGNSDSMWRWTDAAERLGGASAHRCEPLGGSNGSPDGSYEEGDDGSPARQQQLVVLTDVTGPLGIHVVPECDGRGRDAGLHVQRVEPDGAVQRDGRLRVGDRIVQINGHGLRNTSFQRAQEIFMNALSAGELRLLVEHVTGRSVRPPTPTRSRSRCHTPVDGLDGDDGGSSSRVATVTPTKKVPASLSSRTQNVMLTSNTRKLGRRLTVALVKGAAGLGFSVTTRDNPASGHAPVYVKNILPQGAAVEDGRLRPGDRLLEIDGLAVTGLSQRQVVQVLRAVPPGQPVQLVISRHEPDDVKKEDASPKLPRPLTTSRQLAGRAAWTKPPDQREQEESEPTRDKEILVFDIPVHDSERAGLGISVKGKTTASRSGPMDVGIYIKSVIHGGAASKDGRLQRNDQLIDVNYTPLLGRSNSHAMETLRRAMCQEGPKPGVITLTVARRSDFGGSSGRESVNSMLSNSSGEVLAGWRPQAEPDQSGHSEESQVTVIQRAPPPVPAKPGPPPPPPPLGRSPVVDRLAGRNNIRNESYYRATHDTWNGSLLQQQQQPAVSGGERPAALGPVVNMPSGDTGLVEKERTPGLPSAAGARQPSDSSADVAYASQTSLEQAGVGFTRDQLGRQSMSEKRHASKDAKNTDTYQRTKRAREEREQQRRVLVAQLRLEEAAARRQAAGVYVWAGRSGSHQNLSAPSPSPPPHEIGPSLGMKKSSSLESLQTMVHELALAEEGEPTHPHRAPAKAVRGRGCNESFRAAVDRSYEAPLGEMRSKMETLEEDAGFGFSRDRSARQSSMSSGAVEGKKGKRRSGLLRGLGSMFRFSRHRKNGDDDLTPRLSAAELRQQQQELNRIAAQRRAEDEQRRIQQQYQRLVQQQQHQQTHRPGELAGPQPPQERAPSRTDRMQKLREQHQRQHASRRGVYVTDAAEEQAEQRLRQACPPKLAVPPHVCDHINNNVAPPAFVRAPHGHGARSSEYFRNPRPPPIRAPLGSEPSAFWRVEPTQGVGGSTDNRPQKGAPGDPGVSGGGPRSRSPGPSEPGAQGAGSFCSGLPAAFSADARLPLGRGASGSRARGGGVAEAGGPARGDARMPVAPGGGGDPLDSYEQMRRPGSRAGLAVAGGAGSDHQRFGHYANYEQIQHHMRQKRLMGAVLLNQLEQKFRDEARRQHQMYHSQRGRRAEPHPAERPISNYYEYGSVQAMGRPAGGADSGLSLPRHQDRGGSGPALPRLGHGGRPHDAASSDGGGQRAAPPAALQRRPLPAAAPNYGRCRPEGGGREPRRQPVAGQPGSRV